MTERKPAGMSFEGWVDRQIREAEARGEFDDLPGTGEPIPGAGKPYDELWWVKDKLRRENLSYLPPTLALRKRAEDALVAISKARSEAEVRRIAGGINEEIEEAIRRPPSGPPLNLRPLDVERLVGEWRDGHAVD